jgi:hypothetical protein
VSIKGRLEEIIFHLIDTYSTIICLNIWIIVACYESVLSRLLHVTFVEESAHCALSKVSLFISKHHRIVLSTTKLSGPYHLLYHLEIVYIALIVKNLRLFDYCCVSRCSDCNGQLALWH